MERLKTFLKGIFSYPAALFKIRPVTAVSVIVTTLLFAAYSLAESLTDYSARDLMKSFMDYFLHLCLACLFFTFFALLMESMKNCVGALSITSVTIALFCGSGLLSVFLSLLLPAPSLNLRPRFLSNAFQALQDRLGDTTIYLYIIGLIGILLLLAVYFSCRSGIGQPFREHVMNAHASVFFSSIIYSVIQMGVLFLSLIITLLLFEDIFAYLGSVLIIINGIFYVPAVICALIRENEKANLFMQVLVRYVMLIISLLAYVIIYIYMCKLVITRSFPSNSVFGILTALFVISMIISYMCTSFENNGFLQKFAYNTPLIFAPFILLQCYTAFLRIAQYGVTPKRYAGILLILFEIVYIAAYTICRKKKGTVIGRSLLLLLSATLFIGIFFPGINARTLSDLSARVQLSSYLKKSEASLPLSDREYLRANAAYEYLKDTSFGKGRLGKHFPDPADERIHSLVEAARGASERLSEKDRSLSTPEETTLNVYYSSELADLAPDRTINVTPYSRITFVSVDGEDPSALRIHNNIHSYEIDDTSETSRTADFSDYISSAAKLYREQEQNILDYEEYDDRMRDQCVIDLDESTRLYITYTSFQMSPGGSYDYILMEGYLMEK